jgi:hypothetical protein
VRWARRSPRRPAGNPRWGEEYELDDEELSDTDFEEALA